MRIRPVVFLVAVRLFLAAAIAVPLSALSLSSARAADLPVDLELVLTADVSRSIDDGEFRLQRQGYAEALRDKRVTNAIRGGAFQRIAVMFVEWTGVGLQTVLIPWTVIEKPADAEAFAQQLLDKPRTWHIGGGTAVGEALYHAADQFENNGFEGERQVIDISGDGPANRGRPAELGRDYAVSKGITVNGLPILGAAWGLDAYYERNVIGGPGAFSVPAEGFEDFSGSVLRKLIREIAGTPTFDLPPGVDVAQVAE